MMRSKLALLPPPYLQEDLRPLIPVPAHTANTPFFKSQNNTTKSSEWVLSFSRDG